jgi:hypothetical protein
MPLAPRYAMSATGWNIQASERSWPESGRVVVTARVPARRLQEQRVAVHPDHSIEDHELPLGSGRVAEARRDRGLIVQFDDAHGVQSFFRGGS